MGVDGWRHAPTALPSGWGPHTHCTGGWVGLDGCGKSRLIEIRSLDRQAGSESLHRLSYSGLYTRWFKNNQDKLWLVYTQIVPVIFEPPCRRNCIILFIIQGRSKIKVRYKISRQDICMYKYFGFYSHSSSADVKNVLNSACTSP
jgi:hypothetical protein